MRRIHLPEIEDEAWCPRVVRDGLTAFLHAAAEHLHVFAPALPVVQQVVQRDGRGRIVDLCAGGGGPTLSLSRSLPDVDIVLTDLFPNEASFMRAHRKAPRVQGHLVPVDATCVPASLSGVRTLFNALHHFRPAEAKAILEDAARQRTPICIVELVERHPLTLLSILLTPIGVLVLIPFTKPDVMRLLLTYVIPIIPLLTAWDGIASCARAYSPEELNELVRDIDVQGYRFTVGRTARRAFPPLRVTYLVGERDDDSLVPTRR